MKLQNEELVNHYYKYLAPELIRLRLYYVAKPETTLICRMTRDSIENVIDNHPLYRLESINFLKNVEGRLDFWLEIVDNSVEEKIKEVIDAFLHVYEHYKEL